MKPMYSSIISTVPIFALLACGLCAVSNSPQPSQAEAPQEYTPPAGAPTMVLGYFDDRVRGQIPIAMEKQGDMLVIEGDIVLGSADVLRDKGAAKGLTDVNTKLWKKATVPYVLANDFPNRKAIEKAFDEYNTRTKIKMVARTTESDYIEFVTTDNPNIGGQSLLGRSGGRQSLWMNKDTGKWNTGSVIHELAHALGMMHEQCRNDRDNYVEIVWSNIVDGYSSQFKQLSNGKDLQSYDYDSILHYPKNAFGINGAVTIKPKGLFHSIGQRDKLSKGDIKSLHELYQSQIPQPDIAAEPVAEPPLEYTPPAGVPTMVLGYFDDRVRGQIPIAMEKQGDLLVIEGDIVLGPANVLSDKGAAKGLTDVNAKLWKKATVPYVLSNDFPNRKAIEKAFEEYNTRTKIKMVARTTESDYIEFVTTDNPNIGGQSLLGRSGGKQSLWMNEDTGKWSTGTVIHELGHALGLMHEQCRNDRKDYVEIVWSNIIDGYSSQFQQLSNGKDLQAYDYDSILHYPKTAFGINGAITIKTIGSHAIGQRSHLSTGDINSLHDLYKEQIQP